MGRPRIPSAARGNRNGLTGCSVRVSAPGLGPGRRGSSPCFPTSGSPAHREERGCEISQARGSIPRWGSTCAASLTGESRRLLILEVGVQIPGGAPSAGGGTGRRVGFKYRCLRACGFNSRLAHSMPGRLIRQATSFWATGVKVRILARQRRCRVRLRLRTRTADGPGRHRVAAPFRGWVAGIPADP
jgi:hypothetical protein